MARLLFGGTLLSTSALQIQHHATLQRGLPHCRFSARRTSSRLFGTNKKHDGKAHQQWLKNVAREERIAILEESSSDQLTPNQQAELNGLREKTSSFEEQYDASSFSEDHIAFKDLHNQAFFALAKYCSSYSASINNSNDRKLPASPINLFYLDGPDAKTTKALLEKSGVADGNFVISPRQCFVANRHESSCDALRQIIPNVVFQSAVDALVPSTSQFSVDEQLDFGAYYFDGCGGYVPQVIDMVTAAISLSFPILLSPNDGQEQTFTSPKSVAIGYSIVGGNRDVVNKDVEVVQHITKLLRQHTLPSSQFAVHHVLDDPIKFGVPEELKKLEGGTMTTWLVLEQRNQ